MATNVYQTFSRKHVVVVNLKLIKKQTQRVDDIVSKFA